MMFRPMPVLSALTLVSLVILVQLGNWQYDRYAAKIDRPLSAGPSAETIDAQQLSLDTGTLAYVQQVYGMVDGEPLWRRYAPVTVQGQEGWSLAMIEATGGPQPVQQPVSTLSVALDGAFYRLDAGVRPGGRFANPDLPERNLWYRLNAPGMARQLGRESLPVSVLEPAVMTVRKSDDFDRIRQTLNPYAFDTPPDPLPPERHFGYALTWWGMAIGLIGVYLAFHHARGRLRLRS
ncbi:MAG: SURF1 family cytochrome oxidase biogenesis protein [Henriciella sp.]